MAISTSSQAWEAMLSDRVMSLCVQGWRNPLFYKEGEWTQTICWKLKHLTMLSTKHICSKTFGNNLFLVLLYLGWIAVVPSGYKSLLLTNAHYEPAASLTLIILYVCFMLFSAGACCDKLDPICLLRNKQNDKHKTGNIV